MKKFTILSFLAFSILAIASCNKQYNNDIVGNGGSNDFNWSGTAPFSAVMNGKPFVLDPTSVILVPDSEKPSQVAFIVNVKDTSGNMIAISAIGTVNAGDVLDIPYPGNVSYVIAHPDLVLISNGGKIKILENSSSYVSGLFYVNMTTQGTNLGQADTSVVITKGYFRLKKP